jgi:hypothetical protein
MQKKLSTKKCPKNIVFYFYYYVQKFSAYNFFFLGGGELFALFSMDLNPAIWTAQKKKTYFKKNPRIPFRIYLWSGRLYFGKKSKSFYPTVQYAAATESGFNTASCLD